MQMEPTAVKGEDFPLPSTVSLHSVEVRAGDVLRMGETGFAQTALHIYNLLVGSSAPSRTGACYG